jgi:hypothetical protein
MVRRKKDKTTIKQKRGGVEKITERESGQIGRTFVTTGPRALEHQERLARAGIRQQTPLTRNIPEVQQRAEGRVIEEEKGRLQREGQIQEDIEAFQTQEKEQEKIGVLKKAAELFNLIDDPFKIQQAAEQQGAGLIAPAVPIAGAAGTAAKATITSVSQLGHKVPSAVTKRTFVGQPAASGVDKLFGAKKAISTAYATNGKSTALTKSFLISLGLSVSAANLAVNMIGTYPMASFGKEETLQALSFPMTRAIDSGNLELAEQLLNDSDELINAAPSIADKIPYANVQKTFKNYAVAQSKANAVWRKNIETKRRKLEGGS